jgi:hypothetical protein
MSQSQQKKSARIAKKAASTSATSSAQAQEAKLDAILAASATAAAPLASAPATSGNVISTVSTPVTTPVSIDVDALASANVPMASAIQALFPMASASLPLASANALSAHMLALAAQQQQAPAMQTTNTVTPPMADHLRAMMEAFNQQSRQQQAPTVPMPPLVNTQAPAPVADQLSAIMEAFNQQSASNASKLERMMSSVLATQRESELTRLSSREAKVLHFAFCFLDTVSQESGDVEWQDWVRTAFRDAARTLDSKGPQALAALLRQALNQQHLTSSPLDRALDELEALGTGKGITKSGLYCSRHNTTGSHSTENCWLLNHGMAPKKRSNYERYDRAEDRGRNKKRR